MRFPSFNKIVTPFWRWALLLVLVPVVELFLLYYFVGIWFTLLSVLVSGLFGMFLARREGLRSWIELNRQLEQGETPTLPVLHGVLILLAALFMILPGLLTSLWGLFFLFPLTRSFVVTYLALQFESYRLRARKGNSSRSPEIIDV